MQTKDQGNSEERWSLHKTLKLSHAPIFIFSEIPIHGGIYLHSYLKIKILYQRSWPHRLPLPFLSHGQVTASVLMAPQTPPSISEPRTGYTAVLGCAFTRFDITLASFPQVYWQGFSANRITVLKPSTMQPATGNLVWIHWDSPSSCVTVPSQ